MLSTCAAAAARPWFASAAPPGGDARPTRRRLGIGNSSYSIRSRLPQRGIRDALSFLQFCHERGAGGVQLPIGRQDKAYARRLRERAEAFDMYLEGSIRTPRDEADVDRFDAEVRTAKQCGARVVRTVMLSGRRYESFRSADEFRQFKDRSFRSLVLAEPIVAKHDVRLAVENHKDHRADELIALLRRIDSAHVGVCVDTGNNIALLEDATETAKALAPWAVSCHLKDMALRECEDGFLLAEVPLGKGILPLGPVVQTLRQACPEIQFTLEMITRDPLKIPCLTEGYWKTFPDVRGRDLARTLALARKQSSEKPLPLVGPLPQLEKLKLEDDNVIACLRYAKDHLQL